MATTTRKLDKTGLSQVWAKIVAGFVAKEAGKGLSANDFTDELKKQLEDLVATGGEVNVIESISVNGTKLTVTEKGVNIVVPTGTLAGLNEVDISNLNAALKDLINGKADAATTLAGYGINNAYTKEETAAEIKKAVDTAVAGIYKVKGTITFATLPSSATVGDVYNVSDAFTTTASFVEGTGKAYPAGTNVVYTENGWDCMSGVYDFSEYLKASDLENITEEEINSICVMP